MMFSSGNKADTAVYDPSNRCADTASYWQWSNGALDESWDRAAESVNQGWPVRLELRDPAGRWYGAIVNGSDQTWVYRLYGGGKDRFGREGRYFFVLLRLQSVEELILPRVAGIFRYFEAERGLPLKTDPLDHGWLEGTPDELLVAIRDEMAGSQIAGHWGFDGNHEKIRFTSSDVVSAEGKGTRLPLSLAPAVKGKSRSSGWLVIVAVAVAISLSVVVGMRNRRSSENDTFHSDGAAAPLASEANTSPPVEMRPDDSEENGGGNEGRREAPRVESKPTGDRVPWDGDPPKRDPREFDGVHPSDPPIPFPGNRQKSPDEHQPSQPDP